MEHRGFHCYNKFSLNTSIPYEQATEGSMRRHVELNHLSRTSNGSEAENTVREQDMFMPIANVTRIIRKILPSYAKISDDSKETIQECVSEFISIITGEANERCHGEQRKTVTAEDVLWAMSKLGFDDYIEPLMLYLHRYRELEGERGFICGPGSVSLASRFVVKRPNGSMARYGVYKAEPGILMTQYNGNGNNSKTEQHKY